MINKSHISMDGDDEYEQDFEHIGDQENDEPKKGNKVG